MFDKRQDVPQRDRSNERCSRSPPGISCPLLQLLRTGDTTGVLKWFRIQCHRTPGGGEGGQVGHLGRTKNPRWVRRPWYILDGRRFPVLSKEGIHEDRNTSRECPELIHHGKFVV